jgi:hypothetical protein
LTKRAPTPDPHVAEAIGYDADAFVFLSSEIIDGLVATVMELSAELWTVKRRALVTEKLLESRGVVTGGDIETFVAGPEEDAEWKAMRDRFVRRVYSPLAREIPLEQPPKDSRFLEGR